MLNEHTKQKHNENFPCDLCDLIFNKKCKLIEHTDEIHTNTKQVNNENEASPNVDKSDNKPDDKVFQCNECNYKSSSENGIKIHIRGAQNTPTYGMN